MDQPKPRGRIVSFAVGYVLGAWTSPWSTFGLLLFGALCFAGGWSAHSLLR